MRPLITSFVLSVMMTPVMALEVQRVTENVYALIGPLGQRDPGNLGNNATFGVVVTDAGVVLVDPGGSWQGAAQIDAAIDTFTDQPVVVVINSGGQDHRWLGNEYWQQQGATVFASAAAVADHRARGSAQMSMLSNLIGEGLQGTTPSYAGVVFETEYGFDLGGERFELFFAGQAHTPGDIYIWMPSTGTVFSGDIVYMERILSIGNQSHSGTWITAFEAMAALNPIYLVPGHGPASTLKQAKRDTYDYLVNLREQMGAYIDNGGDIIGSVNVEQSAWQYLAQFEQLAKRNAQQVFTEMEWE